jgi:plasmid stabilization system protein ParE
MVFRVELTKTAEADLAELCAWVVARAPGQGAVWFNGLEKTVASLDRLPERCPVAPESVDPKRPVRVLHHGTGRNVYRVLFWIDGSARAVRVLHIRRGSRGQAWRSIAG